MIDNDADINDGKEGSAMDIADLTNHVAQGATVAETCQFLCRSNYGDVIRGSQSLA